MTDAFTAARLAGLAAAYRAARERSAAARAELHEGLAAAGVRPLPVIARLDRGEGVREGDGRFSAYRTALRDEHALVDAACVLLEHHSAWPWLARLPGLDHGAVLALLPLLDVDACATPSAFHAACGLDVVDAVAVDGMDASPSAERVGEIGCDAHAPAVRTPIRVARRLHAGPGEHDARVEARGATNRIARGLIAGGGRFGRYYEWECDRARAMRPQWTELRTCKAAVRRVEKLFLTHLWVVWRTAEGLSASSHPHHTLPGRFRDPWSLATRRSGRNGRRRARQTRVA